MPHMAWHAVFLAYIAIPTLHACVCAVGNLSSFMYSTTTHFCCWHGFLLPAVVETTIFPIFLSDFPLLNFWFIYFYPQHTILFNSHILFKTFIPAVSFFLFLLSTRTDRFGTGLGGGERVVLAGLPTSGQTDVRLEDTFLLQTDIVCSFSFPWRTFLGITLWHGMALPHIGVAWHCAVILHGILPSSQLS